MKQEDNYYSKYQRYREFWQNNIQGIEDIIGIIEKQLFQLERQYSDFDSAYDEIVSQIDILSSIHSCFNTMSGKEYILKLKSLLKEYKKKYSHDGINFNALYHLHSKIVELTDKSISEFPKLDHKIYLYRKKYRDIKIDKSSRPFKWITFYRNGSWFIIPYKELSIIESNNSEVFTNYDSDEKYIKIDDRLLKVVDLFSRSQVWREKSINYFLIIDVINQNKEVKCFAANKIGKNILARKDFISQRLRSYNKKNKISTGYVHIFGKNHIYIDKIV